MTDSEELVRLRKIVNQVDDVLVVNWVSVVNDDYRTALHDLISLNISEHDYFEYCKEK